MVRKELYHAARDAVAKTAGAAVTAYTGSAGLGGAVSNLLAPEKVSSVKTSPATILTNTRLRSYLDKRYARKCGVEVKQQDTIQTSNTISTALAVETNPFVGIPQSLTDTGRIGNTIEVKSLSWDCFVKANTASTAPAIVRVIVVKQGDMNGAEVGVGQILEVTNNIRSPRSLNIADPFTILMDRTFVLASTTSGDTSTYRHIKWTYRPKHCHEIRWTQADTTGALANMLRGNVTVYMMYEGASQPDHSSYFRAEYIDG